MWFYRQSTGDVLRQFAVGYSGAGAAKNVPAREKDPGQGPIPRGKWTIGTPRDTAEHGPYVMPLIPAPGVKTYGRTGFLIHGDSLRAPGTASRGCIILPRTVRIAIWASGDHDLEVID